VKLSLEGKRDPVFPFLPRFGLRLFQKPTGEDIKNHRRS
jgi:hypothetical protein